jgi:hypothetical protein
MVRIGLFLELHVSFILKSVRSRFKNMQRNFLRVDLSWMIFSILDVKANGKVLGGL